MGLLGGYFASRVHAEVAEAVSATATRLETLGASTERVDVEGLDDVLGVWVDLTCDEMVAAHPKAEEHRELLHPRIAGFFANGINLTDERRASVRERTAQVASLFDELTERFDLLVAPATPYPAPLASQEKVEVAGGTVDVHMGGTSIYTRPISLSGLPSLSLPAGLTRDGLPLGVQLVAARGGEQTLLAAAIALEAGSQRFSSPTPSLP